MMKFLLESVRRFSGWGCLLIFGLPLLPSVLLSSCSSLAQEPPVPARKVYAPREIKADDVEYIALCEVGLREGQEINFRSNGVIDRNGLYYVSVVARPYRSDGSRLVVVDESGAIVKYSKGAGSSGRNLPKPKADKAPSTPSVSAVRPANQVPVPPPVKAGGEEASGKSGVETVSPAAPFETDA